jgi:hypothetical protein
MTSAVRVYACLLHISHIIDLSELAIMDCPTCPKGTEFDAFRKVSHDFTYDESTGIVVNGNGLNNIVVRPQYSIFSKMWNNSAAGTK